MKVNKNKEYAVSIYLSNAENWDAQRIKSCIVSKVQTLGSLILAAHAQLPRRVNAHLHTAERFAVCTKQANKHSAPILAAMKELEMNYKLTAAPTR